MTQTKIHGRGSKYTRAFPNKPYSPALVHKHSVWDGLVSSELAVGAKRGKKWRQGYGLRLRATDFSIIVSVVVAAFLFRFGFDDPAERDGHGQLGYLWLSLLIITVWMVDLEICRSRESRVYGIGVMEYRRIIHSTVRVFGTIAIFMVIFKLDVIRGYFAIALPLGLIMLIAGRWIWRKWLAKERGKGNYLSDVVVMGNALDVEYVIRQLRSNLGAGYRVAGAALSSLDKDMELRPPWHKIPVLSTMADISRVVAITGADAVIVAGPLPGGPEAIQRLGWQLEDMNTELVLASNLTNVAGPRVHFRPVEGLPLMHVELPQYSGGKHIFKRAMDVCLAASALLVLLPVLVALAIIVRIDSPGPAFFHQERVGRNGEPFKMYKFRSMSVDAEDRLTDLVDANEGKGLLFKMAHDPRVTKCGSWMRKYSLDELPQFFNVLLGNMSLVGPRPPLSSEVEQYEKPTHRRLLIKPGITGLWQVSGRSDLQWDEAVRLDLYYVENWSFMGDVIILWRTFRAVRSPVGAY